jgi:sulfur-carrier protein adenylyltransferase/sulfurtransferase
MPDTMAGGFSKTELTRYSRHLILPEVGQEGQLKLKQAKVLVVGAGGLGSPSSMYLAAAGVGEIGLVDFDSVDLSNLQRQIIYSSDEVGKAKIDCAEARLRRVNSEIKINKHAERLTAANARQIISRYDIVIDGTDNFTTRYLINDACVLSGKPNVYGSIFRFEGQVSLFHPPKGPCYRCMYPKAPPPEAVPNCAEGGVLGVLAGTIGVLQATEALKYILQIGEPLLGKLLIYDALSSYCFDVLNVERNPDCPICGTKPTIKELRDEVVACATEAGGKQVEEIIPEELKALLEQKKEIQLIDVRTPQEHALCNLPSATLIPINELPQRLNELNKNSETVVYCKSGMRSAKASQLMIESGFKNVRNLAGGITRWAKDVDPSLDVY